MKLMISEAAHSVVQDVKLALAKEQHDRRRTVDIWLMAGDAMLLGDCNPATITLQIEDEKFSCDREKFPTVEMVARMQLAIHAGQSCRNSNFDSQGAVMLDHYHLRGLCGVNQLQAYGNSVQRVWMDETGQIKQKTLDSLLAPVQGSRRCGKTITAAVTARVKKLMKGRP